VIIEKQLLMYKSVGVKCESHKNRDEQVIFSVISVHLLLLIRMKSWGSPLLLLLCLLRHHEVVLLLLHRWIHVVRRNHHLLLLLMY
jgi:hypothetical protein